MGENCQRFDLLPGVSLENSNFRDFRFRNGAGQDLQVMSVSPDIS
jgi:hypothetical protein